MSLALHAPNLSAQNFRYDVPQGFEDLAQAREQFVDVYYEDRFVAASLVTVSPDGLTFINPDELLSALPQPLDYDSFLSLFEGVVFARNDRLSCDNKRSETRCGILTPESVGLIYTSNRFRVDLFISPGLLSRREEHEQYLAVPDAGISLISQFSGYLADGSNASSGFSFFENRSTVGFKNWRFNSAVEYSNRSSFDLEEALVEQDARRLRYLAGLQRRAVNQILGQRRVLGIGLVTQNDTLISREVDAGTPLVVYLRERGTVEVLLDERLLLAKSFRAGSHALDTSSFPEGSYEIDIKINEAGSAPRVETRLFTKDRSLPIEGRPNFDVIVGLTSESRRGKFAGDKAFLSAGAGYRVSERLSLFGSAQAFGSDLYMNVGSVWDLGEYRIQADATGDLHGSYSAGIRAATRSPSPLSFNLEARLFDLSDVNRNSSSNFGVVDEFEVSGPFGRLSNQADLFDSGIQLTGSASYAGNGFRVFALGNFRSSPQEERYDISIRATADIFRKDGWWLYANLDATQSSAGDNAYAGVTLSFFGHSGGAQLSQGYRHYSRSNSGLPSGVVASLQTAANFEPADRIYLSSTSAVDLESGRTSLQGAIDAESPFASATVSGLVDRQNGERDDQYSFGARTTFIANAEGTRFSSSASIRSSVLFRIEGARDTDNFEVLVNEQPRLVLKGEQTSFLSLPSYERYEIRLRPISSGPIVIDEPTRTVTLLPGNALGVTWQVEPTVAVFGRMVKNDQTALSNASITAGQAIGQTDRDGYFQIEAFPGAEITLRTALGERFATKLPNFDIQDEFVELGELTASRQNGDQE